MNPAAYGALPASACALGTQGNHGPDRSTKVVYDAASQVTQRQVAVGTADAANEATFSYTNNGELLTLKDGENNLTTYEYDGHDRLARTVFPVATQGANASNPADNEQYAWDGFLLYTKKLRSGETIDYRYDALGRMTLKDSPQLSAATYAYDNLGRLTSTSQTGHSLTFSYDALSRNLTQVGPQGTVASQWDVAGRRTRMTYPGSGLFVDYDYLVTGEMTRIRENGATSGVGVLASIYYDDLGRRVSMVFGNGVATYYAWDPVSRLAGLTQDLAGSGHDLNIGSITYNPASQIVSQVRSNDAYAWTGHGSGGTVGVANGLNQLTSIGGSATSHDARGNLTADPATGKTYGYNIENLLTSASGGGAPSASLAYDPAMRLHQVAGASTTRFA